MTSFELRRAAMLAAHQGELAELEREHARYCNIEKSESTCDCCTAVRTDAVAFRGDGARCLHICGACRAYAADL